MRNETVPNLMTVDVEDWFHILGTGDETPEIQKWDNLPERVIGNTKRLLDIFEECEVGATFFTLGWIARKYPALVREIAERGFEVASHGDLHQMVHTQDPDAFRKDVLSSKRALEDAAGKEVLGYRAAGFSITRETPWAFDVLAESGFQYDASIFPGSHAHGGYPVPHQAPFLLQTRDNHQLFEFPVAAIRLGRRTLPFGGGGYFRLFPLPLTLASIRNMNRKKIPATLYLHPREVDPEQPRLSHLNAIRTFKYYVNLRTTEAKLRTVFRTAPFVSVGQYLQNPMNRVEAASRLFPV